MRIHEENCNMVLLAAVTLLTAAIAGGASLVGSDEKTASFADRTSARAEKAPNKQIINVSEQPPVRVVGAPFAPNTNPRER